MFMRLRHRTPLSKLLAALMLASLLAIVLFSFGTMTHNSSGSMEAGCPFTAMGVPLCPQDLVAAAVHHISAYQSLLNAPASSGMMALLIALLMLACGVFISLIRPPAFQPRRVRSLYNPSSSARDRETTRWLSLFEHSPSLV
ncbi:hypothetical protein A3C86_01340 [Candidatus Kaiserbacteria bacterium RIFCSPHIGHO2_02_FULL_49_16]|uniref:Uncharacterized protein n=2 Tax=Parcubacteria group TaxID=1794811 RepID=A0A0G1WF61_9BACT|nr:MAG: hypothetical protein UY58_C0007G0007 [Candidatus Magasanikbacteria bacterium GW2011_GWA2_50_22]OGG59011.1 MAG: hypothetical protein A3C86_01340 [Candidatus Kaiserbacteria bacterium RIFCSPHIGHO2_02_FULL_49_16]